MNLKHEAHGHCRKCNPNTYTRCLVIYAPVYSAAPPLFDRFGGLTDEGAKVAKEFAGAWRPIQERLISEGHSLVEIGLIMANHGQPWVDYEIAHYRAVAEAARNANTTESAKGEKQDAGKGE